MNKIITKNNVKVTSRILTFCIIFSLIMGTFFFSGCNSMKNVRSVQKSNQPKTISKKNKDNNTYNKNKTNEVNIPDPQLISYQEKEEVNEEKFVPDNNIKSKIPTLREQLNSIQKEQEGMKSNISTIQNDLHTDRKSVV